MNRHLVMCTSLNVRASAHSSDGSAILSVLSFGTVVEEIGANLDRSWLRIRFGTVEGWVSNNYLLREDAYHAAPWMSFAVGEFGVAELPGYAENNPRIQGYWGGHAEPDQPDEVAWCSVFAKWCVTSAASAGASTIPHLKKITPLARSWHKVGWGSDVTTNAPLGSIAVLWRRGKKHERDQTPDQIRADGIYGHVAFLAEPYASGNRTITLLGGNQGGSVRKAIYALGTNYGVLSIRGLM